MYVHGSRCGCGTCRTASMEAYAKHYAGRDGVPQVVWFNATVDVYGRTPLPEWNLKYRNLPYLEIVKTVQPRSQR